MKPLHLPSALARDLVTGFARLKIERSAEALHHHVLVVREGPWATFTLTDGRQALTYLWRVRAQAQTPLAQKLDAIRDDQEAGRVLVPLADLREAVKGKGTAPVLLAGDCVVGTDGESGGRYATPPVEDFPPVRLSIAELAPGWNHRELTRQRADLTALAAACFAPPAFPL